MNDLELLKAAYERRDAGDTRDLSAIIADIKADLAALSPAPAATDIVGKKVEILPDGRVIHSEILGDGTQRPVVA